jgi:hypothetical protein
MHAECPRIDLQAEFRTMRDHEFGKARSDWPAVYRNWMREATKRLRPLNGSHFPSADPFAGAI